MQGSPENWRNYYSGNDRELWLKRHFSLSDRIRYYWPESDARTAVSNLQVRLSGKSMPAPVLSQYLPGIGEGMVDPNFHDLMVEAVMRVLRRYEAATGEGPARA